MWYLYRPELCKISNFKSGTLKVHYLYPIGFMRLSFIIDWSIYQSIISHCIIFSGSHITLIHLGALDISMAWRLHQFIQRIYESFATSFDGRKIAIPFDIRRFIPEERNNEWGTQWWVIDSGKFRRISYPTRLSMDDLIGKSGWEDTAPRICIFRFVH